MIGQPWAGPPPRQCLVETLYRGEDLGGCHRRGDLWRGEARHLIERPAAQGGQPEHPACRGHHPEPGQQLQNHLRGVITAAGQFPERRGHDVVGAAQHIPEPAGELLGTEPAWFGGD